MADDWECIVRAVEEGFHDLNCWHDKAFKFVTTLCSECISWRKLFMVCERVLYYTKYS